MKHRMLHVLALVLTVWFNAGTARAETCVDVDLLANFIAAQTDYDALPRCLSLSRFSTVSDTGLIMSQAGAYDPVTGQIAVADDLDLASILGQSYLLHELVHYAQFHSLVATKARCPAELEAQAYALQAQYLRANGEADEAVLITVLAGPLSICGQADAAY